MPRCHKDDKSRPICCCADCHERMMRIARNAVLPPEPGWASLLDIDQRRAIEDGEAWWFKERASA